MTRTAETAAAAEDAAAPMTAVSPARAPSPHGTARAWRADGFWTAAGIVAVAVLAAYASSLGNGFAYDDVPIIRDNHFITAPHSAADIWLRPYWPLYGQVLGLYRPLSLSLYAIEWAAGGGNPLLFHVVSVLLHAGVCVALLGLLRRLVPPLPALAGALVFAVHPVHTESVANVVGQAELLAALAVTIAGWLWVARPVGRPEPWRVAALVALYAAGVLAKEHAIVLPGLLLALDAATGRMAAPRRWLDDTAFAWLMLGVAAAATLLLRVTAIGSVTGLDAGPMLPVLHSSDRVWVALRVWTEYARLMFFPLDLSSDYSPAVVLPASGPTPMVLLGGTILAVVAALAVVTPRRPRVGLPAAWFLVAVLPVSNLLFPIGVFLAERTLYLPSIAVALVGAFALDAFQRRACADARPVPRAAFAAGALVLLALAARAALRNPVWADTPTVTATLYREHPESYRAQWSAAQSAWDAGDTAVAADRWRLAYRLWPHDPTLLTEYGRFLLVVGRAPQGLPLLERAHARLPFSTRVETSLALAYLEVGRDSAALAATTRLARMDGPGPTLFRLRGRALAGLGRADAAAGAFRAVSARPDDTTPADWMWLATSLEAGGHPDLAAEARGAARSD